MKSLIFLTCFFLFGCVSSSVNTDSPFITDYDEVTDTTVVYHKDLELGYFYNLKDSISGERENIRLRIIDDSLYLTVDYQFSLWSFFHTAVFIADKNRLEIPLKRTSSHVVSGSIVRESFSAVLSDADTENLLNLLQVDSCGVAFIGDKYMTDKLAIKPKIRDAFIQTIELYN